ncbi:MAG TPA: pyridoxal-dependent decarboxylase [Gemmatimonadaceae bacterium]|nr:pyridoxal-dependent decarboxylase [Gemmatimonadaceae bacterium]
MPQHPDERAAALRSWFLGPHAENEQLFHELIEETVQDHFRWRKSFHPEDPPAISAAARRSPVHAASVAELRADLRELADELKQGVPFFSPRYKAHMIGDQTMAAQLGYFAAMLHNPNNVSAEVSPVTSRLEMEVARDLGRMIGYDSADSWGHLTAGGTIANFEALWIARSIFYFPVAVALAAADLNVDLGVDVPGRARVPLQSLSLFELLNLTNESTLNLLAESRGIAAGEVLKIALERYSLASAGYQDYARTLATRFGDPLEAGVVLVPATAHYSWEKIVRALGIGANQLLFVAVDEHARMDPDNLWDRIRRLAARQRPIIACVSVAGSTEEGAFDRLDSILEVRDRAEDELGVTFHIHSDACYGGYAATVTWRADGRRRTAEEIREATGIEWPQDTWVDSVKALSHADSISIDPHKLGYVPYPAGALLLRDGRARALVATEPPYILPSHVPARNNDAVTGRFAFEGSRPGAAAAAVWLSHRAVPLDERGYGYLMERTAVGARALYDALSTTNVAPFTIVTLPPPDLNIVCFLVMPHREATLQEINALNEGIYHSLSVQHPYDAPDYVISRTVLRSPVYRGVVEPLLGRIDTRLLDQWNDDGLVVLRAVVMDPFLATSEPGSRHGEGFIRAVRHAAHRVPAQSGSLTLI